MERFRRIPRLLGMLLLCMGALPSSSFTYVFCIGQDGHFAMETASLTVDIGVERCSSPDVQAADAEASHCGTCHDVALIRSSHAAVRDSISLDDDQVSVASTEPDRLIPRLASPLPAFVSAPVAHSALADMRTIVLHI